MFPPQILVLTLIFTITTADAQVLKKSPLAEKSSGAGGTLFEKLAPANSGIDFTFQIDPDHPLKRLYAQGWAVGNVAIGDLNGDGQNDLFFAGGSTGKNRLYVNRGSMKFEEVAEGAGAAGSGWSTCAVMGDVDRDGDLDVFVTRFNMPCQLFINVSRNGVLRFQEKAAEFKVAAAGGLMGASFVDINRDGNLDLYLAGYHIEPESGRPENIELSPEGEVPPNLKETHIAVKVGEDKTVISEVGSFDAMLINQGNGTFVDGSLRAGIGFGRSYTMSTTWADLQNDGLTDMIVSTDLHGPDLLFRQIDQGFEEIGFISFPVTPWLSRCSVAADFNNDLLVDIFSTGTGPASHREKLAWGEPNRTDLTRLLRSGGPMQVARSVLLANTGTRRFTEIGIMAGIAPSGAANVAKAADFDCDGWTDLFVATGEIRDRLNISPANLEGENLTGKTRWDLLNDAGIGERRESDVAWRNTGDFTFQNATAAWGLDGATMSYAAGKGDLDGDGDPDLVVCRANEPVAIYRNQSKGNRVKFTLSGIAKFHTGAEVRIEAEGKKQMQQFFPTGGFRGSDAWELSFGLGETQKVDKVTVSWPGGLLTTHENLEAGHHYDIAIATTKSKPVIRDRAEDMLFLEVNVMRGLGYAEIPFDERGALFPARMSHQGPALAIADLNGDGDDEIFVGGSAGVSATFLARDEQLGILDQPFDNDAANEDMGAVFFDADGDGDIDLYAGSGGLEYPEDHEAYRDRLYLNDGTGQFSKGAAALLPDLKHSTSAVAAADYDGDGDSDLLIGSRAAITNFPESPGAFLLQNNGSGKFVDRTAELAPQLANAGMITSAIWTDANGDGSLDLMMTTDWGPIRFFKNTGDGRLIDETESAGLADLTGMWRGLAGRDIDNDGDIDYVATNAGLNTPMNASVENPKRLLWGNLAGTNNNVLLETTLDPSDGNLYPTRPFIDWIEAVPAIKNSVDNPTDFVKGGFGKVFTPERLESAKRLEITTLESGVLVNNGTGNFSFQPLPRMAQISPGFGVVLADFDLDGWCDCLILQNEGAADLITPEPADKGLGVFLKGTGNADALFEAIGPSESGFGVIGSGRSLGLTDIDSDSIPDVIGLRNGSEPATFVTKRTAIDLEDRQPVRAELGNRGRDFGSARVTLKVKGHPNQTAEYYAGGGYLSQSTPVLFFSAPKGIDFALLEIRWADGHVEERPLYFQ